jgi:predicted secreted protein
MNKLWMIFISFLLLAGCRWQEVKNESPAINEIKKGGKFRITLPEDHTKGYTWVLNDDFDKNVIVHWNSVWHGNEKGIDFNFKALDQGKTTLHFFLRKHTDTTSYKIFNVKITDN